MEVLSSYEDLARLTIVESPGVVEYTFSSGEITATADQPKIYVESARELAVQLDDLFLASGTTDQQVGDIAKSYLADAVPPEIQAELRQWNGAGSYSTLVVETVDSPWLADLPWELIPSALDGGLLVVRMAPTEDPPSPGLDAMTILLAGWSVLAGTAEPLPGIRRELEQMPKQLLNPDVRIAPVQAPTVEELASKAADVTPDVVHLVTANGFGPDPDKPVPKTPNAEATTYLLLDPEPGEGRGAKQQATRIEKMSDDELIAVLNDIPSLRLCVVNTQPSPPAASSPFFRKLITETGVPVLGWSGIIGDAIAADFSLFLYSRIVEGFSLPEAVRAFTRQFSEAQWVSGAIPVIWLPSDEWLDGSMMEPSEVEQSVDSAPPPATRLDLPTGPSTSPMPPVLTSEVSTSGTGGALVTIDFAPQESLFPSLLINGQDALKALSLIATEPCKVRLEIVCDAGGKSSVYRGVRSLLPGPNTIDIRGVGFPVLYELMESNEPRIVNFQIAVSIGPELLAQETRSVRWRARREWLDSDDSHPYLPSFVLPMSKAVAGLIHDAESVLTQIGGPQESSQNAARTIIDIAESADRHVKAIYQAMRARGLKYITPPGAPVFVLDPSEDPDAEPIAPDPDAPAAASLAQVRVQSGQLVRFPGDIVERGHATCHDLALLLAAAIEYINMRPVIVVLPGHTLVGFWVDNLAHEQFWRDRSAGGSTGFGSRWSLTSAELVQQVEAGAITMVETTMVTNPVARWTQAKKRGAKHLQQEVRAAVDVRRSRESIQPLSYD